ncbi:MAG: hypothetical protein AAF330_02030 [Pseudomonadota bacterium]
MVAEWMASTDIPGMKQAPACWMTYFAVDDVEAAAGATCASGGQVMQDPFDVPGVGRIVMVANATGADLDRRRPVEQPDNALERVALTLSF